MSLHVVAPEPRGSFQKFLSNHKLQQPHRWYTGLGYVMYYTDMYTPRFCMRQSDEGARSKINVLCEGRVAKVLLELHRTKGSEYHQYVFLPSCACCHFWIRSMGVTSDESLGRYHSTPNSDSGVKIYEEYSIVSKIPGQVVILEYTVHLRLLRSPKDMTTSR